MQRQHTENSSTSNIYKTLKNIELCNDGIRFPNGASIRLSNIRHFPNNLIYNTSFLFQMACLLSLASLEKTAALTTYFGSPDKKQNYKVLIEGNSNIHIEAGDCDTIPVDHAVSYGYQLIKQWLNPANQIQTYHVQAFQGEGEPVNQTIQNCAFDFIQRQINTIQAQVDIETAARHADEAAKKELMVKIFFSILGTLVGIIVLISFIILVVDRFRDRSFGRRISVPEDRPEYLTSSEYSPSEDELEKGIVKVSEIKEEINKPKIMTMIERIENLKDPNIIIPDDFICPVNKVIMTDPCFTDDGYTYEREVLVRLQKDNAKSPVNPEVSVINIIQNNPLRSSIMTFVENQEAAHKDKEVTVEVVTTTSLRK